MENSHIMHFIMIITESSIHWIVMVVSDKSISHVYIYIYIYILIIMCCIIIIIITTIIVFILIPIMWPYWLFSYHYFIYTLPVNMPGNNFSYLLLRHK